MYIMYVCMDIFEILIMSLNSLRRVLAIFLDTNRGLILRAARAPRLYIEGLLFPSGPRAQNPRTSFEGRPSS